MSFFLFMKQIVDMLYSYKILDYCMVGLVFLMLIYQIMLVRPDFRSMFTKADGIVIALCGLLTISFMKSISEYETYFKILSAFFMYFVGRIYYERIQECYGALVASAYVVVYLNLFNRISNFGGRLFQVTNAGGDLYYYDTDMAFAMILAFVFITMFGKNSVFKLFTILLVCPYMVFYSDAGIQKVLFLIMVIIILVYIMELVLRKQKFSNIALIGMITSIIAVVVLLYLPLMGVEAADKIAGVFEGTFLNYQNMRARYIAWNEVLELAKKQGIIGQIFGNDLSVGTVGIYVESLYIKTYYVLGWTGLLLALGMVTAVIRYIAMVKDRKTFYLMVMMIIILLGSGVTINSMERAQMGWFPMMFAGMVVSSVQVEGIARVKEDKTK
mgnify:CR=1 FL=1